jgi:HK97 family phage major capsid protein
MEDIKTIKADDLKAQIKAELEAEAKAEAKAKADAIEAEKKLREEIKAQVEKEMKVKLEAAPPEPKIGVPAIIKSKGRKMDEQSEQFYDALQSKDKSEFELDMDINETEEKLERVKSMTVEGTKANLDGATGYGPEFVPEEWAPGFYFRLGSLDGNLMNIGFRKYAMNTDVKNIAEILTKPTISAYSSYQNQNLAVGAVTATDVTTANKSLNARIFVAKLYVYNTLLKDEKFGLMRGIKRGMAEEMSTSVSSAILNGDTTTTHMDEDYEALGANIPEAMWKGLRKLTLAGSLGIDGTTTYTLADLDKVQKLMGKYAIGSNLRKSKWIMGVKTYNELMGLMRASTSTPQAADFVVKEGHIISWMGHPIIVSDKQREDLEIDGYYDASGTAASEGFCCLVNVDNFVIGARESLQVKVIPDDLNDRKQVTATMRLDFQPFETPSTTVPIVAGMYAYTLS